MSTATETAANPRLLELSKTLDLQRAEVLTDGTYQRFLVTFVLQEPMLGGQIFSDPSLNVGQIQDKLTALMQSLNFTAPIIKATMASQIFQPVAPGGPDLLGAMKDLCQFVICDGYDTFACVSHCKSLVNQAISDEVDLAAQMVHQNVAAHVSRTGQLPPGLKG